MEVAYIPTLAVVEASWLNAEIVRALAAADCRHRLTARGSEQSCQQQAAKCRQRCPLHEILLPVRRMRLQCTAALARTMSR